MKRRPQLAHYGRFARIERPARRVGSAIAEITASIRGAIALNTSVKYHEGNGPGQALSPPPSVSLT